MRPWIRPAVLMALAGTLALTAANSGAAQSASSVVDARRAGIVGERYDGYLGLAAATPDALRRKVAGINIRRRALYTGLATRRGVTPQTAGIAAGCELLSRVAVGESYMLADGKWRRRGAGEAAPKPPHCASD